MTTETKKRANSVSTFTIIDGVLTWDYGPAIGKVAVDSSKGSAAARAFLFGYGLKQWLQDGAAVEAGPDGKVDPRAKFDGMLARAEIFLSGADALTMRKGKSDGADSTSLLVAGIMRGLGRDADGVEALLVATMAKKGVDRKGALDIWAKTDKVGQAILAIKAERAQAKLTVDASDLEAEMMGEGDDEGDKGEAPF